MKWNKSSYKNKSDIFVFKICCMIMLIMLIIWMSFNTTNKWYLVGYVGICSVSLLYFLNRTRYIHSNITKNELILTSYSEKILKIHKFILSLYTVATILIITICMYQLFNDGNMHIWIWYASVLPMMYSDSVYLSGLTAFGNEKYASGEYLIDYSSVDDIKMICEKNTTHGTMVLCSVYCGSKEIGYDKIFTDEYHKLRLKIYQNKI